VHGAAWSDLGDAFRATAPTPFRNALTRGLAASHSCDVVFANGITDPSRPLAEIVASNVDFPRRVIETLGPCGEFRFITIGSIQERFGEACAKNRYLASKEALGRFVLGSPLGAQTPRQLLHIRLHTLYGGKPPAHMFLGQMLAALERRIPFQMSAGTQLREYQHADDIARAFREIMVRTWDFGPIVEIQAGEPVRLAELARAVFAAFGQSQLLSIGTRATPAGENVDVVFPRSPTWLLASARPTVPGIIDTLRFYMR
jgi:nucleoside-diphosphate-sugar epimerase